jgi:hypothetical protein
VGRRAGQGRTVQYTPAHGLTAALRLAGSGASASQGVLRLEIDSGRELSRGPRRASTLARPRLIPRVAIPDSISSGLEKVTMDRMDEWKKKAEITCGHAGQGRTIAAELGVT